MYSDAAVIQMAVAVKLAPSYRSQYGEDHGLTIGAAVTNKLFGKASPAHTREDLEMAEHLAAEVFRADSEVRYAALMACRAKLLFEAEMNNEQQWFTWDTIQWMATIADLPNDQADPAQIHRLASTLHRKYLHK